MANPALARRLRTMPLFRDLRPKELALLTLVLKERTVEPGETIVREGDPGNSCFFVLDGEVSVQRLDDKGTAYEIARVGADGLFGQISLVDDGPRSASCVAAQETELLQLNASDFEMLFNSGSQFAFRFQEVIARHAVGLLRQSVETLKRVREGDSQTVSVPHDDYEELVLTDDLIIEEEDIL